jgi:hypothetical protein
MDDITPPLNPRPIKPERRFKVRYCTKQILNRAFAGPANEIDIKSFVDNLTKHVADLYKDDKVALVRRRDNYLYIEERVFIETEKDYNERCRDYELKKAEHDKWDNLPNAQKKIIRDKIKKQERAQKLRKKQEKIKLELLDISDKIRACETNE